jgi:hypothetical protein
MRTKRLQQRVFQQYRPEAAARAKPANVSNGWRAVVAKLIPE